MKTLALSLILCISAYSHLATPLHDPQHQQYRRINSDCPENWSGRGTCKNVDGHPTCVCDQSRGGTACQWPRYNLSSDEPLSVTVHKSNYNASANGPAIFVGRGYYPTANTSDYNNTSLSQRKTLTILYPEFTDSDVWYLGVLGQDRSPLILSVQVNLDHVCLCSCSYHGQCNYLNGYASCNCGNHFFGDYCQEYTEPVKNGSTYSGSVKAGFWNYWHFNITSKFAGYLEVNVSSAGVNTPDLYTSYKTRPDTHHYSCRDASADSSHICKETNRTLLQYNDAWFFGKGGVEDIALYCGVGVYGTNGGSGNYTIVVKLHDVERL